MEIISTRRSLRVKSVAFCLLIVALGTIVVSQPGTSFAPNPQKAPTSTAILPSTGTLTGTIFDHVVIIVMENEGIYDICRQNPPPCSITGPAPYVAGVANNYTIGSHYLSLINTSQPNYVALLSGSMQGCTSGGCPVITAPNLVDRFEATGLTWRGYFENQTLARGCDMRDHDPYTVIHDHPLGFVHNLRRRQPFLPTKWERRGLRLRHMGRSRRQEQLRHHESLQSLLFHQNHRDQLEPRQLHDHRCNRQSDDGVLQEPAPGLYHQSKPVHSSLTARLKNQQHSYVGEHQQLHWYGRTLSHKLAQRPQPYTQPNKHHPNCKGSRHLNPDILLEQRGKLYCDCERHEQHTLPQHNHYSLSCTARLHHFRISQLTNIRSANLHRWIPRSCQLDW